MEREWGEWSLFSEQWIASSNFRLHIVQRILWSAWRPWAEKFRNEFVLGVTGTVLKHMWNIRCATKCLSNLSWCNKQSVIPSWRPWSPWWPKSSWSPLWLWSGLVLNMFQSWVFKKGYKVVKILARFTHPQVSGNRNSHQEWINWRILHIQGPRLSFWCFSTNTETAMLFNPLDFGTISVKLLFGYTPSFYWFSNSFDKCFFID